MKEIDYRDDNCPDCTKRFCICPLESRPAFYRPSPDREDSHPIVSCFDSAGPAERNLFSAKDFEEALDAALNQSAISSKIPIGLNVKLQSLQDLIEVQESFNGVKSFQQMTVRGFLWNGRHLWMGASSKQRVFRANLPSVTAPIEIAFDRWVTIDKPIVFVDGEPQPYLKRTKGLFWTKANPKTFYKVGTNQYGYELYEGSGTKKECMTWLSQAIPSVGLPPQRTALFSNTAPSTPSPPVQLYKKHYVEASRKASPWDNSDDYAGDANEDRNSFVGPQRRRGNQMGDAATDALDRQLRDYDKDYD